MKRNAKATTPLKSSTGPSQSKATASPEQSKDFDTPQKGNSDGPEKPKEVQRILRNGAVRKKNDSSLSKSYMSKSHDNLASVLRRKASAQSTQRPRSVIGLSKNEEVGAAVNGKSTFNKENQAVRERSATVAVTTSPPKKLKSDIVKRAKSTPNIDQAGAMKKASSTQNISKMPASVKRASSTQNVSRDKAGRHSQRTSAPANIMAYNAELLASFEKEKKILEGKISELRQVSEHRKTEIERLKFETKRLKECISDQPDEELELLRNENRLLKDRLHELGVCVEQITDSEKLSMLQEKRALKQDSVSVTSDGMAYSKQASRGSEDALDLASLDSADFGHVGLSANDLACVTPEHPSSFSLENSNWEKQSNKSHGSDGLSEMSVSCLQDRITQMEETHYSTSEELQATLQELGDLQSMVNELTLENERLADEKAVLLESLCAQTEKLEHCRMQIEHLKSLLVSENDTSKDDREYQLLGIIKSSQVEKEEMLLRQMELCNCVQGLENQSRDQQDIINALKDKSHLLEDKNESFLADKKNAEEMCRELKEQIAAEQIELQRYKTLLDNEKAKVAELEQFRNASDKTELEELLDNTRQEKDKLEVKLTDVQEALAHSQCEVSRLKELLSSFEEEMKVIKNNAKMSVSDMEYKIQQVIGEKMELRQEMETLRDHIDQLEQDCDRYLEEKKGVATSSNELQAKLDAALLKNEEYKSEIREINAKHEEDIAEWKQFQSDLQKAVVIANDIKTETQEDMEQVLNENAILKEKINSLSIETNKLRGDLEKLRKVGSDKENTAVFGSELRGRVKNSVDRELANLSLRGPPLKSPGSGNGKQNLSVKKLICSIEQHVKVGHTSPSAGTGERRGSVTEPPVSPKEFAPRESSPVKPKEPHQRRSSAPSEVHLKSALKKTTEVDDRKPPLNRGHTFAHPISSLKKLTVAEEASPPPPRSVDQPDGSKVPPAITSILSTELRRNSVSYLETLLREQGKDPLATLVKQTGGSKRNALLKWCQSKTAHYSHIDITNFSSSWNDGLAFCAIMHSYLPHKIPYSELDTHDKKRNFTLAFKAAESIGIPPLLSINEMAAMERPDWQAVMGYVTSIYKHFEIDNK
ncbi:cytospin-A-like isoform X2 [Lineus longissimus]|uniref:cytospin-A-like isoform X2 n=1 Tax=Lineus longissimus TaxID=88925 RepID=UPI00315D35DE